MNRPLNDQAIKNDHPVTAVAAETSRIEVDTSAGMAPAQIVADTSAGMASAQIEMGHGALVVTAYTPAGMAYKRAEVVAQVDRRPQPLATYAQPKPEHLGAARVA